MGDSSSRALNATLAIGLTLPAALAHALEPFDITDPTPRPVVIFIDDNFADPQNVGGNLLEAFTGAWATDPFDPNVGVIVVTAADTFDAANGSSTAGTPVQPENWQDMVYRINVNTGHAVITAGGVVDEETLGVTNFAAKLETRKVDAMVECLFGPPADYEQAFFRDGATFKLWCTDIYDVLTGGICSAPSASVGPEPFAYDAVTGRINAIGPVMTGLSAPGAFCEDPNDPDIGIPVFGTFGDAQLFEIASVPALSGRTPLVLWVLLGLGALIGAARRSRARV